MDKKILLVVTVFIILLLVFMCWPKQKSFMEKTPYISVILPTRKRSEQCIKSIESLYTKAQDKNSFEILLAFDNDDTESKEIILDYCKKNEINHSFISIDRVGYENFEIYVNKLCEIAKGEMCLLWGDDALNETDNWDQIVKKETTDYILYLRANKEDTTSFPIVPSKYIKTMGHFSLQAHCDSWIQIIFKELLNIDKVLDINIYHSHEPENKMNVDYSEINYTTHIFHEEKFKKLRIEDTNKIIDKFFPDRQHVQDCR
jgi:glycosyltransferase involved in cell wall biosynthesis